MSIICLGVIVVAVAVWHSSFLDDFIVALFLILYSVPVRIGRRAKTERER